MVAWDEIIFLIHLYCDEELIAKAGRKRPRVHSLEDDDDFMDS